MMEEMEKDPAVRLKLASDYAGIANYWKFFDGERKQLLKYDVYDQKKKDEEKFIAWAKDKPAYESIFTQYATAYDQWSPYTKARIYMNEGIAGSPLAAFARSLGVLELALSKTNAMQEPQGANLDVGKIMVGVIARRNTFLASEDIPSDRKIMATTAKMFYDDIDQAQLPQEFYQKVAQQYGPLHSDATFQKMADYIFDNTMLLNDDKWKAFVEKP